MSLARNARNLRKKIGDIGFPYWVRVYSDGTTYVAPLYHNRKQHLELLRRMEILGFKCECNGVSGTSGEFVIDIVVEKEN